ncbi:MAG: ketopantoate reductase family protein [Anaerolineaceae bacterium]|nr:ketopantoate reductase family protein [Anaerolineaceae bacterium]
MSFLCFGVGAIGTYIGGSLAAAGNKVVFVERPSVAAEVRQHGLTVGLPNTSHRIPHPEIADSIEDALSLGPFDAGILAVKSFDTQSVLDGLLPYAADIPPILSFQNGVENEPLLARKLGTGRVIPGTVTTAVGRNGAGDIVVERLRGIGISTLHPMGSRLVNILDQAGLRAHGYANPAAMKWSKMLTNLITNATAAILNLTPAEIFANPALYQIEARQMRETLRVMKGQNIPVVDLPSTPVKLLAWIAANLPLSLSRVLLERAVGKGRGGKMPSFHIDLYSGRGKSEVDYLNGAVVRYGTRFHVPTPVNKILNEILLGMTSGEIPLDKYAGKPEKFLADIPGE